MKLSDLKPITEPEIAAEVANQEKAAEEPWGVAQAVTPSGVEIYYQAGPKRLYRVRQPVGLSEGMWEYTDWVDVPSASTVLQVLEKGGLSWWGMKVGVEGLMELARRAGDTRLDIDDNTGELIEINPAGGRVLTVDDVIEKLKTSKLTVHHVKGKAADRGTNVHSALELYAEAGTLPNPENYPENEAGYVRGLVEFLKDTNPIVHHSELMVASSAGFAGRFDMVASLAGEGVVKTYPKRTDKREEVSGRWLLDLKTSKGVYPSYHLQLAGYEGAMEECGYGLVDQTGVVRVTDDGRYELVKGRATFEDFLAVLDVYRIIQRLEGKA